MNLISLSNLFFNNLIFLSLLTIIEIKFVNSDYIDLSDMTDARIVVNRLKYSEGFKASAMTYKPTHPFPDLKSCMERLKVKKLENSNRLEDHSDKKLMDPNDKRFIDDYSKESDNELDESLYLQCVSGKFNEKPAILRNDKEKATGLEVKSGLNELYNVCVQRNKQLTEELVCYRNLQKLFNKNQEKINKIIDKLKTNDFSLQLYAFTHQFKIINNVLGIQNCLL